MQQLRQFLTPVIDIEDDLQLTVTLLHYILLVTIFITVGYILASILLNFSPELF